MFNKKEVPKKEVPKDYSAVLKEISEHLRQLVELRRLQVEYETDQTITLNKQ